MSSLKFWVVFAIGFTILLVGGVYLLADKSGPPAAITAYGQADPGKPVAALDSTLIDLGAINVSQEKTADFILKNTGQKPLQLFNISSSCGCVTAKIMKAGGWASAEFGMHAKSKSVIEVAPDEQVKITVTYRPYVMPVRGLVGREVYLSTNDPLHPRLTLKIQAQVS